MSNGTTTTTTAMTTKPKAELTREQATMRDLNDLFGRANRKLAEVAPKHITAERMVRVMTSAISRNPKLMECTPSSLLQCLVTATELGLEPNTPLQLAYLIPRKNTRMHIVECTFLPSYRGLMQLARQSGLVKSIYAYPVHEGDKFDFSLGLHPTLNHVPLSMVGDADDEESIYERKERRLKYVYAVAHLSDGAEPVFVVMTVGEVERIRARSQARDDGPWQTDYTQMAIKTAVRRLCKLIPASPERADALMKALELQAHAEAGTIGGGAEDAMVASMLAQPQQAAVAELPLGTAPVSVDVPAAAQVEPAKPAGRSKATQKVVEAVKAAAAQAPAAAQGVTVEPALPPMQKLNAPPTVVDMAKPSVDEEPHADSPPPEDAQDTNDAWGLSPERQQLEREAAFDVLTAQLEELQSVEAAQVWKRELVAKDGPRNSIWKTMTEPQRLEIAKAFAAREKALNQAPGSGG